MPRTESVDEYLVRLECWREEVTRLQRDYADCVDEARRDARPSEAHLQDPADDRRGRWSERQVPDLARVGQESRKSLLCKTFLWQQWADL